MFSTQQLQQFNQQGFIVERGLAGADIYTAMVEQIKLSLNPPFDSGQRLLTLWIG